MVLLVENATWSDIWAMTGIGIGTVFVILILLVLILGVFNLIAKGSEREISAKAALPKTSHAIVAEKEKETATDDDLAAVATALYLFYKEIHDEESFVLTIHHHEHNAWRPEHY